MLSYCLKCRKNTESKNSKVVRAKEVRKIFLSKWSVCDNKKSEVIKEQKGSGLVNSYKDYY